MLRLLMWYIIIQVQWETVKEIASFWTFSFLVYFRVVPMDMYLCLELTTRMQLSKHIFFDTKMYTGQGVTVFS